MNDEMMPEMTEQEYQEMMDGYEQWLYERAMEEAK